MEFDPRVNAIRLDLADDRLQGLVSAHRYASGVAQRITVPVAPVQMSPQHNAVQISQALFGEAVRVFEEAGGWCWCQLMRDGYVGYISKAALGSPLEATHRVAVPWSFIFPEPDIKSGPTVPVPLNAEVSAKVHNDKFHGLATGGFMYSAHVSGAAQVSSDFVAMARLFIGTPYLWGGKSYTGVDCSGLVQISLHACGQTAPRDSDMQEHYFKTSVPLDQIGRGDLVFWRGHVGIMTDQKSLLHANGHHMQVVEEPLVDVVARSRHRGSEITSIKRLRGDQ